MDAGCWRSPGKFHIRHTLRNTITIQVAINNSSYYPYTFNGYKRPLFLPPDCNQMLLQSGEADFKKL
jgi:hypothetical protein